MAARCNKCGGIISDIPFGVYYDTTDCENHVKPKVEIDYNEYVKFRSD
jgi:hypothetical protein